MKLPTIKDSRERESLTLTFVSIAYVIINVRFLWDMLHKDQITLLDYASAIGAVLGIWLLREWTEKTRKPDGPA